MLSLSDNGQPQPTPPCSKDGFCWENPAPHGNPLFKIWGSSASDVWAVAKGLLQHWDGSAWSFVQLDPPVALAGLWGSDANNVWAVGEGGTILRWTRAPSGDW
jgi:hypothetical protein